MRITTTYLTLAVLVMGCGRSHAQNPPADSTAAKAPPAEVSEKPGPYWEKLAMHPFVDGKGTVVVEMPFPSSWKVATNPRRGEPSITGPNHIKVIDFPVQTFVYTADPQMQQIYLRGGQPLRMLPGIEQLIQQDLAPWCASQGREFVRHYEVPEVSRIDKWYSDQLYKALPSESTVKAIGTEWRHSSGNHFFMLMHLNVNVGGGLQTWSYYCSGLQAEKAHFETARKQFLFGLANARHNPQPIMEYNRAEAERVGRSWEEHNRRMAANQANFEASQRAFVNRSRAVNETIMKGWNERNASSDKAHERFVDAIAERSKVRDSETGELRKVEGLSNQFWMNQDGEYFGTDNRYYDPNRDQNMNRENWRKLEVVTPE